MRAGWLRKSGYRGVAALLAKALPEAARVALANELVSADAEPRYSDEEVAVAELLLDAMTHEDAHAVIAAMELAGMPVETELRP